MKVNLICGFLGSGKTTLLKRVLAGQLAEERVAVLVNEFGAVGIDGEVLRREHVHLVEIASGCICCTVRGALVAAVQEIHDAVRPARLLIEATGLAQPADLLAALTGPPLDAVCELQPVVTVVDAAKFTRIRRVLGPFYQDQVARGHLVLLNKADQAPPDEVAAVAAAARALNPRALILPTRFCDVDVKTLLYTDLERFLPAGAGPGEAEASRRSGHRHAAADREFGSVAFAEPVTLDRAAFERFLRTLPADVFRGKGFLRSTAGAYQFQFVTGDVTFEPAGPEVTTRMAFIGRHLDPEGLCKGILACVRS